MSAERHRASTCLTIDSPESHPKGRDGPRTSETRDHRPCLTPALVSFDEGVDLKERSPQMHVTQLVIVTLIGVGTLVPLVEGSRRHVACVRFDAELRRSLEGRGDPVRAERVRDRRWPES